MRKKEHIYIHALLVEVTRQLIEDEIMSVEMLAEYNAVQTRPSSIHKSKQNHHEAILALGSAIESCLNETRTDRQERSIDR